MTENARNTGHDRDPIGAVAEEARRLFDSLQGRATRHVGRTVFHSFTGGADRSEKDVWSEAVAEPQDEYICRACPVCRAIAAQRESGGNRVPDGTADVATHLVAAGGELFAAFRGALDVLSSRPETRPRDDRGTDGRDNRDNVEHIDLD